MDEREDEEAVLELHVTGPVIPKIDTRDYCEGAPPRAPRRSVVFTPEELHLPPGGHIEPVEMKTLQLLAANHCKPSSLIVVDVDETLVMTSNASVLTTAEGVKEFQRYIRNVQMDLHSKNVLCQKLQAILDRKVACEPITSQVLRQLQGAGCWVLGLTARYSHMSARTNATLSELAIDLSANSPLPRNQALQDPDTKALFCNGVIFTNAMDKGDVLNRFLTNVVFRPLGSEPAPSSYKEIVFVDDRLDNAQSVLRGLHIATILRLPVYAYHYTGSLQAPLTQVQVRICEAQIRHFLHSNGTAVLTDEQVIRMQLIAVSSPAAALQAPSPSREAQQQQQQQQQQQPQPQQPQPQQRQ
jgi:hypothetical protein